MRSSAFEIARAIDSTRVDPPNVILASDYLDLPSLYGQLPARWSNVPALVYFHENQLTYPTRDGERDERDLHFGFTNIVSAVRAASVVFNSRFHRDAFSRAALALLERLPRPNPLAALRAALAHAEVIAPGVELDEIPLGTGGEQAAPLRVLYNQRWEHDKDPAAFLEAMVEALRAGARLELVLLGQHYADTPPRVAALLEQLGDVVREQDFAADRAQYARRVGRCDLVVSTAQHEFFGLAVVEAIAAGCTPLLPDRLSYPELFSGEARARHLYTDRADLVGRLCAASRTVTTLREPDRRAALRTSMRRFSAAATAKHLDDRCDAIVRTRSPGD